MGLQLAQELAWLPERHAAHQLGRAVEADLGQHLNTAISLGHQTGRADFRHPAFRLASPRGTRRGSSVRAISLGIIEVTNAACSSSSIASSIRSIRPSIAGSASKRAISPRARSRSCRPSPRCGGRGSPMRRDRRATRLLRRDAVRDSRRDLAREAGLAHHDRQQRGSTRCRWRRGPPRCDLAQVGPSLPQ